ncbi:MAG: sigma-54-dependent Fis family transcriptional regulator [Saprospiraceae bacterium]|nr:sigma-54-dependent Fis family transcriptional regulator [Saprospiraceae bacterium]
MSTIQGIKQRFGILGRSPLLDNALERAIRVAPTDLSVLITGESGVGKESFSLVIHALSARKHNQFIAINCGAIPEGTINSELFGHEKGSFTGAVNDRKGYFETVDNGTIFLDEIGEMPLDTQSYLLRLLESGEFIRVGSSKPQKTNVRVIAATNVNLEDKISKGKFREDLYYRLSTVPINVPSLRERPEDINLLFRKFSSDFAEKYRTPPIQLDERAKLILENYAWPGNIRELKNMAEQVSLLSDDRLLDADKLLDLFPYLLKRNLPSLEKQFNNEGLNEREILYKLLFEMRSDLVDLKTLVYELIRSNNLQVPDPEQLLQLKAAISMPTNGHESQRERNFTHHNWQETPAEDNSEPYSKPVILNPNSKQYDTMEIVDEKLSLVEMEKDMIKKALKKYKSRRKEAAEELGISERTLYRKIKEYDIDE